MTRSSDEQALAALAEQLAWMPPGPVYLLRSTLATASLRRQRRTARDTAV